MDTLQGGDGHFTRGGRTLYNGGTDTMQGVGGQILRKGWRINIIQGGDGHYNRERQTL